MTPLFLPCSFAAERTEGLGTALPEALGCKDKTLFGRRSEALEILTTWALLKGAKAAIGRSRTASATRVHLVRFLIDPPGCREHMGRPSACQAGQRGALLLEIPVHV